jgi:hypothetical protein
MAVEEIMVEDIKCKNCGSTAVVRFGKYQGIQRHYWYRKFLGYYSKKVG